MSIEGNKPWLLDKVHVILSNGTYRAQPPSKVVQNGQTIIWDAHGKPLKLTDDPRIANPQYSQNDSVITATIKANVGDVFAYTMTCDDSLVEGNSPPTIVVDP